MKILHTADLHLRSDADERWQALIALLELGSREKIDLLVICGDLFDRGADLRRLQDSVRQVFSGLPFTVLVLPGNHDAAAFGAGLYLGDSAAVLDDWQRPFEQESTVVWGLPFEPLGGKEILGRLHAMTARAAADRRRHLLLLHGELLDAFFSRRELGEEGSERYMPVRLSYFQQLPFDAVLAGHFHAGFRVWSLERDRYFVYPGSPVSVTRRETGRRKVNLFTAGGPPGEYALDTFHFAEIVIKLDPFTTAGPLEQVRAALAGLHPAARFLVTVGGYIDGTAGCSEAELAAQVRSLVEGRSAAAPVFTFKDIGTILADDLFRAFQARLEQEEGSPAEKERRRELALRAMMEVKLC